MGYMVLCKQQRSKRDVTLAVPALQTLSCPHGAGSGTLANRQHPQPASCPPPCPGCVNPLDFPTTFWCGGCVGTPACACTRRTQMPRKTTPAGRQLCLGLEKHPKLQRKNRIMKCLGGKRKKKSTLLHTAVKHKQRKSLRSELPWC